MKNEDATNTNPTDEALEQIDVRRRKFLSKLLAGGAAVAALPAMSTIVLGDDDAQGGGKGKGGKGKGGKGKGGKGKGDFIARRAEMMIKKFDKDGDGALNLEELTAAITEAMSRRGKGQGGKGQGGKGQGGKGKGQGGKGKGKGGKGKGGGGKGKGKGRS